jgi:signal transduction histidine kinase/ligand-binding sensor domain-containing protein
LIRKSIIAFILLILATTAGAQSYYFRHYQVEEGLSNNTVFCSGQDKRGFLWMGTKDGLNRFDGYTFKVFRSDPDDKFSIGDNFIRSIYIDTNDHVYAGTRNGLYRFNPVKENFTLVTAATQEIRDIKKDKRGWIWYVSGQTVFRLNETTGQSNKYPYSATSVCVDKYGEPWISTANGMLLQYRNEKKDFVLHDLFNNNPDAYPKWIEKIYATGDGTILIGTSNYGVKEFDQRTSSYTDVLTYNPDRTEIFARDFVQSGSNEYWIATESGVFIYNKQKKSFQNLKKQYNNPYSVSDNAVYTLCKDQEGGIWAGTYFGGMNYFPRQFASFEKFFPGYNSYSLSGNAVREICKDKFGNIWVGTEDAGLNKLDPKTGLFKQYLPTGSPTDISYSNIHGLLADDNQLWIGTFEHGLDIMDIPSGKVVNHFPSGNDPSIPRSNFVVVIYKSTKGKIYIGTRQGLYLFNRQSGRFEIVSAIPAGAFIHSVLEDKSGTIWVGTMGNGLFYFNEDKKQKGGFVYDPVAKNGLTSNSITTLYTVDDVLWIGTEGGGLCKLNLTNRKIEPVNLKERFPSNTIFKILEDGRKRLWITTSNGLICYQPGSDRIEVYTTANGLLSNQFNYNSGFEDEDGHMYFGSARGMVKFNPDSFVVNKYIPPVYITGLFINDQEIKVDDEKSPLKKSISFTDRVELKYNQASFSIDFAALSFTSPGMTEYMYIMEGLDKEWTYLKTNRKVYFTDLSPGSYTFKVRATMNSGIWNGKDASVVIEILPPFWASKLAYFVYALAIVTIAVLLFRNYHRRLNEKTRRKIESLEHEKEKAIYQAKIEFFTNVAHEIKTPLTLIKAPMEKIVRKEGDNPELGQNLRIMERNTDRLIELTNQLLDFRRVEATGFGLNFDPVNISELLKEYYGSFKPLAEQKNIRLTLKVPPKDIVAHVDLDSIQKVINNLLSNAVNYCKSEVDVHLLDRGDYFTIEVSNDGNPIPVNMREKIFEPFVRLNQGQNKSGSGIGLALTKSLVDLHNGTIQVKETELTRTVFVLTLPVRHKNVRES